MTLVSFEWWRRCRYKATLRMAGVLDAWSRERLHCDFCKRLQDAVLASDFAVIDGEVPLEPQPEQGRR